MDFEHYCNSIIKNLKADKEITNSKLIKAKTDCQDRVKTLFEKYRQQFSELELKKDETEKKRLYVSNINKENELLQIEIDNAEKELENITNNNDKILAEIHQIELRKNKANASLSEKDRHYMENLSKILHAYKSLTGVYWDFESSRNDRLCGYVYNREMKRGKYFKIDPANKTKEEVADEIWSRINAVNGISSYNN